jgi:hypothetical protein
MNGDPSATIEVTLLGEQRDLPAELLAAEPSRHKTDRDLSRVSVSFAVPADRSDEINQALSAARSGDTPLSGANGNWLVLNSSYSYRDGATTHHYEVELQELEPPPVATVVEMLELSMHPETYKEEVDDGILMVSILVFLEGDDDLKLEAALRENRGSNGYFSVVRHGVSDIPLRMRFGRCIWQIQGSGRLHLLRLVDDGEIEDEPSAWAQLHQPELGRSLRKIAALEDRLETLITVLRESGVLNEEQAAAIQGGADGSWSRHERDFDETTEIERYID